MGASRQIYRDPNRPDPNSRAPLPMQISTGGPALGTTIQIADAVDAAGIRPEDGQGATEDNEEDDDFITVGDAEQPAEDPVMVSVTGTDVLRTAATGNPGGPPRLFESDNEESDAQMGNEVEAMLAEGGPLDIPEVVDNEEVLGEGGDQSSDDDEDSDDADVTHNYYATTPRTTGTTAGAFNEATQGVQACAEETLFGAARLAHMPTGEDQMVRNLENYTRLLTRLQQLVMVMAQGYQNASEDIRELVSSTLARATERDRAFIQRASAALGEWTRAYQAAVGSHTNIPMFDLLQRWDQV